MHNAVYIRGPDRPNNQ